MRRVEQLHVLEDPSRPDVARIATARHVDGIRRLELVLGEVGDRLPPRHEVLPELLDVARARKATGQGDDRRSRPAGRRRLRRTWLSLAFRGSHARERFLLFLGAILRASRRDVAASVAVAAAAAEIAAPASGPSGSGRARRSADPHEPVRGVAREPGRAAASVRPGRRSCRPSRSGPPRNSSRQIAATISSISPERRDVGRRRPGPALRRDHGRPAARLGGKPREHARDGGVAAAHPSPRAPSRDLEASSRPGLARTAPAATGA